MNGFMQWCQGFGLWAALACILAQSIEIERLKSLQIDSPTGTLQEFEIEVIPVPREHIEPEPEPSLPIQRA